MLMLILAILLTLLALSASGRFEVANDRFVLDGKPTRLVGCEIHYFRIPAQYWQDRLQRVKALGCDSIQIYVPWNFHEPAPGVFDWHGERDIVEFIKLAAHHDLHTLLRPGPYICAEFELGGLPAWLLDPSVTGDSLLGKLRSADATYLKYVSGFWQQLFQRIAHLMSARGGPVLMVQVENEYGFFNAGGDTAYVEALWQMGRDLLGNDTVLYTTDPPWVTARGGTFNTVNVVDFGVGRSVKGSFQRQREANKPGQSPPMCSEFYTGWLTHWGERMARTSAREVATTLQAILHYGGNIGSVVLYMAHGGTNFGFWAGANGLLFDITSYDYDCPIRENAACNNDKFKMLQKVIADATGKQLPAPATDPPAAAYGTVHLAERAALIDNLRTLHMTASPFRNSRPGTMEENSFAHGAIEYWTSIDCKDLRNSWLYLRAYDLAHVRVNGHHVGTLWRAIPPRLRLHRSDCPSGVATVELAITVFAYGRDNFFKGGSPSAVNKGIVGDVVLRPARGPQKVLTGWHVAALPLVQPGRVLQWGDKLPDASTHQLLQKQGRLAFDSLHGGAWHRDVLQAGKGTQRTCAECWARAYSGHGPMFYRGNLHIKAENDSELADTYMHTSNFARGYAWINGHNLGRFWAQAGPQQALYVPKAWLQPGDNDVVILEIEIAVDSPRLEFTSEPDFSGGRLSQEGAPMLGGLLWSFWESMHNRGHERFFMLDTLKRAMGIM